MMGLWRRRGMELSDRARAHFTRRLPNFLLAQVYW